MTLKTAIYNSVNLNNRNKPSSAGSDATESPAKNAHQQLRTTAANHHTIDKLPQQSNYQKPKYLKEKSFLKSNRSFKMQSNTSGFSSFRSNESAHHNSFQQATTCGSHASNNSAGQLLKTGSLKHTFLNNSILPGYSSTGTIELVMI